MSLQEEGPRSPERGPEKSDVSMKPKISYSIEYLLSLSNLDICKKLPSGLDQSLTSEFEDALIRIPDRPRIPGSQPLQGFRRNEYSSSPPTRGNTGNYSRGIYGKWENRGRSSDSQSDRDSDSGRRYGHQSRRSWQNPEHDGLLGSGSFPRPSGYSAGISAPKGRADEHNQLSRSSEPYHPPRPYKAPVYSRRDTDSYNDETFGSIEGTNEDRAEEERRRRASFEMMRKEQQKALQEKQKLNLEKHKASDVSDIFEEDKGLPARNNELEVSAATPNLSSDSEKSSFASHAPAPRPLIPPGFKSSSLEKSSGLRPLVHPPLMEVVKPVSGESLVDPDPNIGQNNSDGLERQLSQENSLVGGQPAKKIEQDLLSNKGESVNAHVCLDVSVGKPGMEDQVLRVSSKLDSHVNLDDHETPELNAEVLEDKNVHDFNRTSILEKIFFSTLSLDDGRSSSSEHHDVKPDDTWSPKSVHSSKFAQWFFEDETKAADDLLSLIVSGDKVDGVSDQVSINNKEEAVTTVLTCEDLEQSILSEYSAKTTDMHPVLESWNSTATKTEQTSASVDDHASLQLLSMLQKSNITVNSGTDINLDDRRLVSEELDMATVVNEPKREENSKILPDVGKALTLETLFGSAFMKELQSSEAPVSLQRGSIGSARVDAAEPHGLPFLVADNDVSSPMIDKSGLQKPSNDYSVSSNHRHQAKLSQTGNWLGFDDSQVEITSSKLHDGAVPRQGGAQRVVDFQLPEENNLISVGDIQNHQKLTFMSTGNSSKDANLSSSTPINITEKLAAFGAAVKDERNMESSERLPFAHNSYEQMEPGFPYRNLQVQQSPPLFQAQQISQLRPLHHHLISHPAHMSSQLKFLGPEPMFNQDSPASPQFSSNMIRPPFHHPNVRVAGFDVPSQHSMLHQMQMPGNHPPHFPRAGPISHHGSQATNFVQEMNQMQGFPLGPHQQNIGSQGLPMPGNTPEALQRLIDMEHRAKSKQIHPLAPGHSQATYGHEVDLGFRYR